MAIGYSPLQVPFKLTPEDMGVSNYPEAIRKGFEAGNTPAKLSASLLGQHLTNALNKVKAQYAPQQAEAELAHLAAQTQGLGDEHGMRGLRQKLLEFQVNQAQSDADLNARISQGMNNPSAQPSNSNYVEPSAMPGTVMPTPTLKDNITDGMGSRTGQNVVSPGNPSQYHLDDMLDSDPRIAPFLKKKYGVEKKVTAKYDPKTGITTTMTQYPSGKVTVDNSGVKSKNGISPLTTKSLSSLQSAKVAIPQLRRVIDKLIKSPSPAHPSLPYGLGDIYRAGDRKQHEDLVNLGKDLFAKSKGLTTTEKALETGMKTLERGNFQSDASYHEALLKTKALLDEDEKEINNAINLGVNTNKESENNNIVEWTRDSNGKPVRKQ